MANTKIGILGGGQLARMLALSAHPMGLDLSIYVTQPGDPAAQVSSQNHLGSLKDPTELRRFLSNLDYVTFESEFVDTKLLKSCLPESCHAFPSLVALETIQDRLTQKQLLDQHKVPTSPWIEVSNDLDLMAAHKKFPKGFVLKQRRFGYDGYGTYIQKTGKPLDFSILKKTDSGFIAEELILFKRELAISLVRNSKGEMLSLPLVESVQVDSRCFSVHGPLKSAALAKIERPVTRMMKDLGYEGILAVEMFETSRGLLVNELAPRVHNSAHYTQDALSTDQFEYHLRAGLGMKLPKVELLRPGFAMVNLLGEDGREIALSHSPMGHLHWYGKRENRKGRKLGHINVLGKTAKAALTQALKWRKDFKL